MEQNEKGFSVLELFIIILILIMIALVGWFVDSKIHKNNSSQSTKSAVTNSSSQTSSDTKVEQDLADIGTTLNNYANNSSSTNNLPDNLSQLDLKGLNYSLEDYGYKVLDEDNGGPNASDYQICANFSNNTFTSSSYNNFTNNQLGQSEDPQMTISEFSIHSQGQQCFVVSFAPDTGYDLTIVLYTSEKSSQ